MFAGCILCLFVVVVVVVVYKVCVIHCHNLKKKKRVESHKRFYTLFELFLSRCFFFHSYSAWSHFFPLLFRSKHFVFVRCLAQSKISSYPICGFVRGMQLLCLSRTSNNKSLKKCIIHRLYFACLRNFQIVLLSVFSVYILLATILFTPSRFKLFQIFLLNHAFGTKDLDR